MNSETFNAGVDRLQSTKAQFRKGSPFQSSYPVNHKVDGLWNRPLRVCLGPGRIAFCITIPIKVFNQAFYSTPSLVWPALWSAASPFWNALEADLIHINQAFARCNMLNRGLLTELSLI